MFPDVDSLTSVHRGQSLATDKWLAWRLLPKADRRFADVV
jgi:hypothetical protein